MSAVKKNFPDHPLQDLYDSVFLGTYTGEMLENDLYALEHQGCTYYLVLSSNYFNEYILTNDAERSRLDCVKEAARRYRIFTAMM